MILKIQVQNFFGWNHVQQLHRSLNIPQQSSFKLSLLWLNVIGKLSPKASNFEPNHSQTFTKKCFYASLSAKVVVNLFPTSSLLAYISSKF